MTSPGSMETLVELVARDRRTDAEALLAPGAGQVFDYHRLCTTTWKTANFLHARGVHERSTVAVANDARAEPLLAVLGASLLGARCYVGAPKDLDARAVVAHAQDIGDYDLEPHTQRIAYGAEPNDADVYHFEGDVWSENPTMPPEGADRSRTNVALVSGYEARTHGELLDAADAIAGEVELVEDTTVAVRAPLADPRALVAGVLAPLGVGATVLFPTAPDSAEPEPAADVAVIGPNADAPEPRSVSVREVEF